MYSHCKKRFNNSKSSIKSDQLPHKVFPLKPSSPGVSLQVITFCTSIDVFRNICICYFIYLLDLCFFGQWERENNSIIFETNQTYHVSRTYAYHQLFHFNTFHYPFVKLGEKNKSVKNNRFWNFELYLDLALVNVFHFFFVVNGFLSFRSSPYSGWDFGWTLNDWGGGGWCGQKISLNRYSISSRPLRKVTWHHYKSTLMIKIGSNIVTITSLFFLRQRFSVMR